MPLAMSLFRSRRSLKPAAMDPTREVPPSLIDGLLEDATWAPTHGLTQPWRFHVFQSPAARARLAEGLTELYDALTPPAKRDAEKRSKLDFAPRRAPVVVALVAAFEPNGKIPEWEEVAAVACAAQNLMLSAHAQGLGSYWSSPPLTASPEFVRWLGHDAESHRGLGLLYVGWPAPGQPTPSSTRLPLAQRVTWHQG
ncbi:nitroreductase family protein [Nibricoccus sp. IMCC34717]|uniref:nitroreductase family protein n=1 Tax=Nibricoccus sp. IMCC34717 TaxID=3034021 RepID=UPI00384DA6A9